jgi:hypothetical protein
MLVRDQKQKENRETGLIVHPAERCHNFSPPSGSRLSRCASFRPHFPSSISGAATAPHRIAAPGRRDHARVKADRPSPHSTILLSHCFFGAPLDTLKWTAL